MKYYLIAGEASGDLHGSNLIRHLISIDPKAEFRAFGGDKMREAGADLAMHINDMSFSGIIEIVRNIRTINKTLTLCKNDIKAFRPDAVILIDYPGFNLKIAGFAKKEGIKTLYYIAPKIWASRKFRIRKIRRTVDKLWTILPFEETYFKALGCDAEYCGNPLNDAIGHFVPADEKKFRKANGLSEKPVIALLAGSRKSEVRLCLPPMLKATGDFGDYELVIAAAPTLPRDYYAQFISDSRVKIVYDETYNILNMAQAAIVTSGTATLETALFRVPEVVFYKVGTLTYLLGRPFVRIRFFSLVNIIMDREIVKEFLQFKLSKDIRTEITRILNDNSYRVSMLNDYAELSAKIGKPGTSERVAQSMYRYLNHEL